MLGSICLWNFSGDRLKAEVGYDLNPAFHGMGLMDEAMKMVLRFGFDVLKLESIEAYTQGNNEPSKRLLVRNHFVLQPERMDEENPLNFIYVLQPG